MKQTLQQALDEKGYETLTPVQEAVSDASLQGRDLLVSAQTGSGKTLGFGLAIAPQILGDEDHFTSAAAPLALVIAPTRELAMQVKRELAWLFAKAGARLASCVGGMDMRDERRALDRGAHIVVATPGRLRDHIMRGSIDLSQVRSVVLDEADEMLDLGFREDLEFILGEAPEDRQTLLFSATVPKAIAQLAKSYQRDAERIVTKSETKQHADITYKALQVAERDAENAVINTLLYYRAPNAIVFGNTRAMVNRLTTRLSNRGFRVVALSGELSQSERTHALQAMRDGRADVCVATDVAARGIDLPNLDLVVHAELPSNHETLLHRSGRTGRAGRKGVSALIVTKKVRKKAERILGGAKLRADWEDAPSADAVNAREEARMLEDAGWQEPVAESEADTVARLQDQFTAEQLAAGYLRLYRSVRSAPEELSSIDSKPAQRPEFGPSTWFSVTGGRKEGAEPRRLLPMICRDTGLTSDDIGAIRIQQSESYFEIRQDKVAAFKAALGADNALEEGAIVSELSAPPKFAGGGKPGPRPERRGPKPDRGPRAERKSFDKPDRAPAPERAEKPAPRPAAKPAPKQSSAPIDWNDDPVPRQRKPKPADRKPQGKPDAKPAPKRRPGASDPSQRADGRGGDARPHRKGGGVIERKPRGAKDGPKGPPPPKGKPSSKKNRARTAEAKFKPKGPKRGK